MRKYTGIAIAAFCLVLILMLLVIVSQSDVMTGFVALGEEEGTSQGDGIEGNFSFTREDALQAINEGESIIEDMKANGFSGVYVGDLLLEAEKAFQQADFAEILRGNINSTSAEKGEARDALVLINWRDINYSDVLEYTDEIEETRDLAFLVQDLLLVQEKLLGAEKDEEGHIVSFSVEGVDLERFGVLINEVQDAIKESRYGDAKILAEKLDEEVDLKRTETLTALVAGKNLGNFLKKYWYWVALFFIVLGSGVYYLYRRVRKGMLRKKIYKMRIEAKVLMSLMKKTQEIRFKDNKISGLVYNIRMKKYQERLSAIKEELPVLEGRFRGVRVKKKPVEGMVVESATDVEKDKLKTK
jgi:hypothetical protein